MSAPRADETAGDSGNDLGPGQIEQIIIALLIMIKREIAAIVGLGQPLGLDLGSVSAVLDQDALCRGGADCVGNHWALTPSKWQMA
jgi:hypothetical protein